MNENENCISKPKFETVYKYISRQIEKLIWDIMNTGITACI